MLFEKAQAGKHLKIKRRKTIFMKKLLTTAFLMASLFVVGALANDGGIVYRNDDGGIVYRDGGIVYFDGGIVYLDAVASAFDGGIVY